MPALHPQMRPGPQLLVVIAAALTLISGCASSPSPSPSSGATPHRTASTTQSPAGPTPTPTTPPPMGSAWVAAGTLPAALDEPAEFLALAGGGAVLLGPRLYEDDGLVTLLWEPATGTWRQSASLRGTRWHHAATPLADGRLFVTGGLDRRTSLANSYVFDPVASAWTEVAPMTRDRTHPSATLLPDGRVLVVGGYHYAPDPELSAARSLAAGPAVGTQGAVLFDSGPGPLQGRALATAELFNPQSGTWSSTGPMRYARTGPVMTTLADGRVLVVGSSDDHIRIDEDAYRTAEVYDPETGRFDLVASLPRPDRSVLGGVDIYDAPSLPGDLGSLVALPDGGAVLVGRYDYWSRAGGVVRSFRLSADGSTWTEIDRPMAAVYGGTPSSAISTMGSVSASLPDGSVLVAGGEFLGAWSWDEIDAFPDLVRRYAPDTDLWSSLPAMPEGRLGMLGGLLSDGSIMIAGGFVPASSGDRVTPEWTFETDRFIPG